MISLDLFQAYRFIRQVFIAGLRRSYIKLVRLRRMREAYACKRKTTIKGTRASKTRRKHPCEMWLESVVPRRGWVRVKKRESINRGRVTGNRWYHGHRHDDKCLVHCFQLPTCLEGQLCPDDVAVIKTQKANIIVLRDELYYSHCIDNKKIRK